MRYLLLIYGDEVAWNDRPPEEIGRQMEGYEAFTQWLRDSGRYLAGDALHPTNQATTVRVRDGRTMTTDGPFAETKEQLGGYYLIEAENLDQAIEAASKVPAAVDGSIEIRPIVDFDDGEVHEG